VIIPGAFLFVALLGSSWILDERTAPRPYPMLRLNSAGNDLGTGTWPARVGAAGYIEVWAALADADDEQTLVQIVGAPALPVVPRVRPALQWEKI